MMTEVNSLNPQTYSNFISNSSIGGKLYVPVKPSQVIFSQFEHVSGFASSKTDSGVPVSKIKILNTLIDQLVKIKTDAQKPNLPSDLTDSQIDALIEDYQNKITTAINSAKQTPFGLTGISPETGLVVNTMA